VFQEENVIKNAEGSNNRSEKESGSIGSGPVAGPQRKNTHVMRTRSFKLAAIADSESQGVRCPTPDECISATSRFYDRLRAKPQSPLMQLQTTGNASMHPQAMKDVITGPLPAIEACRSCHQKSPTQLLQPASSAQAVLLPVVPMRTSLDIRANESNPPLPDIVLTIH
jgi:hypothetical protein